MVAVAVERSVDVVVVAWHSGIVVGGGVGGVVVVQTAAAVHGVFAQQGGDELGVLVDGPVPREQCCRREVLYNARVALLAVLIAPGRIIEPVVGNPVHLVGRSSLRTTLGGVAPCDERYGVLVVEYLFCSQEIAERIVAGSVNEADALSPTVGQTAGKGPSAFGHSRVVGVSTKCIMSTLARELENRGYVYYDWNVSSGDAGGTTDTNKVYTNVINGLGSGRYVVLQHDSKGYSVKAVERIIQYGLANGYSFEKLSKDSMVCHHGTAN